MPVFSARLLSFLEWQLIGLTNEVEAMLWTIIVILLILWLAGFGLGVGGGLVHLILVVAVIVLIFNLVSGRRTI